MKTHNSDRMPVDNPIDIAASEWARGKVAALNRKRVEQGLVPVDGDVLASTICNLAEAYRAGFAAAMGGDDIKSAVEKYVYSRGRR